MLEFFVFIIINIISQGTIAKIYIIKNINPSPGPSPDSITKEHGKIENKNDIAKTVNVSFRLVKFLTKRKTIMATIMIIIYFISNVCYFLSIYKNTTFPKYFSILFPLHIQQSKQLLIFTNIIHCLDK